jgi:hypothetical protein
MTKLCYVTAFLDINRGEWKRFGRSFEDYLSTFLPYIDLFMNNRDQDCEMIVYIDDRHYDRVRDIIDVQLPIKLIKINEEWMSENFVIWKRQKREQDIMDSDEFKQLVGPRVKFPECHNARYTLINHSKIEFVCDAMKYTDSEMLCWSDMGYFMDKTKIPRKLVNVDKLDKNKITYTLINPIKQLDFDFYYTLQKAHEVVGGFWFSGPRDKLLEYRELYQNTHLWALDNSLVDDDQCMVLQCYFRKPELFNMVYLGGLWHLALLYFQK